MTCELPKPQASVAGHRAVWGSLMMPTAKGSPIWEVDTASQKMRFLRGANGRYMSVLLSDSMWEYVQLEARDTGSTELDVYEEEMRAKRAMAAVGDDAVLLARAEMLSQWPDRHAITDEKNPF